MRNIYHLLLSASLCALASCTTHNPGSWQKEIPEGKITELSFQEIKMEPLIGNPYQIEVVGNTLLIADDIEGKALLLYNMEDSSYLRMLNIGQGPEDVITPLEIEATLKDSTLHVFQRRTSRCRTYDINALSQGLVHMKNEIPLEGADRFTASTDRYVTLGFYEQGIMSTFNDSGKVMECTDLFPDISIDDISLRYKMFQGHLAYNESTGCLMYAPSFASHILFYKQDGENNWIKQGAFRIGNGQLENRMKERDRNAELRNNDIRNCIDAYATTRYFYALYAGNDLKQTYVPDERYILRFTSDGEFDRLYKVNPTVKSICVTEDDSTIFALLTGKDQEYAVAKGTLDN